ncbi:hypothetical protein BpHYR1_009301 [Brachionus plicatilis]|uniref:Uncharacterized protein n=1 Tax=Brachionus plicatilis TaxID=10195 RepID=A0A3M7S704_BRAPC|nr:hypothetical protein BpHYR1_009301 [Brachionus plicatilis]
MHTPITTMATIDSPTKHGISTQSNAKIGIYHNMHFEQFLEIELDSNPNSTFDLEFKIIPKHFRILDSLDKIYKFCPQQAKPSELNKNLIFYCKHEIKTKRNFGYFGCDSFRKYLSIKTI